MEQIATFCDIDLFRKLPTKNDLGKDYYGTKRLKAPEENELGATIDELTEIPDIGPIIAKSIVDYCGEEKNQQLIEKLKQYGLNMEYLSEEVILDDNFRDKTFVLKGTLSQITRDEASHLIEERGGKTTSSVTKKTSIVVVGDNPGSKYDKAISLNIEIWDEKKFLEKINKTN